LLIDEVDHICNKETNKRLQSSPLLSFLSEFEKIKDLDIMMIGTTSNP
jgi:hypothetical protein